MVQGFNAHHRYLNAVGPPGSECGLSSDLSTAVPLHRHEAGSNTPPIVDRINGYSESSVYFLNAILFRSPAIRECLDCS